jgi:hypothetical protein
LLSLRQHWDVLLTAICFLVIGLVELSRPNVRPSGTGKLIRGLLWDAFGNLGVAMNWWFLGAVLTFIIFFKKK